MAQVMQSGSDFMSDPIIFEKIFENYYILWDCLSTKYSSKQCKETA